MSAPLLNVFVYGTLKQGQERGRMWPRAPLSIVEAFVQGELFDLGPYPAMCLPEEGSPIDRLPGDRIAGEVWSFAESDMFEVLRVLDAIEGYAQPGEHNLYLRTTIEYMTAEEQRGQAYTYCYAHPAGLLTIGQRIAPDATGICRWPRA